MKKVDGLNIAVGKTIKELRVMRNLSQEDLAEKCDTSAVYISEIERGIKNPTVTTLMVIAHSLDLKMSELVNQLENNLKYE
ncbi:MAG: helix-turn-helix transcriptional regulator [Balneola sp.]